jgi:hypothetical protein
MKLKLIYTLAVSLLSFTACQEDADEKLVDDKLQGDEEIVSMGDFIDLNTGHSLRGKVLLVKNDQGKKILRLEDFSVVNGPDVNVYLSKTANYQDVIDLGDLKGTMGNIHYDIDAAVNTDEYKYVLVWCVKFAVLFGYSEQKK